jgi:hypothetical protein
VSGRSLARLCGVTHNFAMPASGKFKSSDQAKARMGLTQAAHTDPLGPADLLVGAEISDSKEFPAPHMFSSAVAPFMCAFSPPRAQPLPWAVGSRRLVTLVQAVDEAKHTQTELRGVMSMCGKNLACIHILPNHTPSTSSAPHSLPPPHSHTQAAITSWSEAEVDETSAAAWREVWAQSEQQGVRACLDAVDMAAALPHTHTRHPTTTPSHTTNTHPTSDPALSLFDSEADIPRELLRRFSAGYHPEGLSVSAATAEHVAAVRAALEARLSEQRARANEEHDNKTREEVLQQLKTVADQLRCKRMDEQEGLVEVPEEYTHRAAAWFVLELIPQIRRQLLVAHGEMESKQAHADVRAFLKQHVLMPAKLALQAADATVEWLQLQVLLRLELQTSDPLSPKKQKEVEALLARMLFLLDRGAKIDGFVLGSVRALYVDALPETVSAILDRFEIKTDEQLAEERRMDDSDHDETWLSSSSQLDSHASNDLHRATHAQGHKAASSSRRRLFNNGGDASPSPSSFSSSRKASSSSSSSSARALGQQQGQGQGPSSSRNVFVSKKLTQFNKSKSQTAKLFRQVQVKKNPNNLRKRKKMTAGGRHDNSAHAKYAAMTRGGSNSSTHSHSQPVVVQETPVRLPRKPRGTVMSTVKKTRPAADATTRGLSLQETPRAVMSSKARSRVVEETPRK